MRIFARRLLLRSGLSVVLVAAAGVSKGIAQRKPSMEVIVRLHSDAALAFRPGGDAARRAGIEAILARSGAKLVPVHPGTTDPELGTWFVVPEVPEDQAAPLAAALRDLPGVAAAYPQPRPEPA
jgi:hypothetical protein